MSEETANIEKKRTFNKVSKWLLIILAAGILEGGAILGAVYLAESRNEENNARLTKAFNLIKAQTNRVDRVEKFAEDIAANHEKIAEINGMLELLSQNFSKLKEEVGNKKIEVLQEQFLSLSHRIESVEETKNQEALILSLALIIKENSLYGRLFESEADILSQLAGGQTGIEADIETINALKGDIIATDLELISDYKKIADNFSFEKAAQNLPENNEENSKTAVSKSIELIKDTVAGINFDKVVVLKKDKKTSEQKLLLLNLGKLVDNHQFSDAISYIDNNPQFFDGDNPEFTPWLDKLRRKSRFDTAISHLIAFELGALREDIKANTLAYKPHEPQIQNGD